MPIFLVLNSYNRLQQSENVKLMLFSVIHPLTGTRRWGHPMDRRQVTRAIVSEWSPSLRFRRPALPSTPSKIPWRTVTLSQPLSGCFYFIVITGRRNAAWKNSPPIKTFFFFLNSWHKVKYKGHNSVSRWCKVFRGFSPIDNDPDSRFFFLHGLE